MTIALGDLELVPLLDGYLRLDGGAMFGVREYLIFFEHDPEIACGYIREEGGRRRVERVA